jgi:hypothetical protein
MPGVPWYENDNYTTLSEARSAVVPQARSDSAGKTARGIVAQTVCWPVGLLVIELPLGHCEREESDVVRSGEPTDRPSVSRRPDGRLNG